MSHQNTPSITYGERGVDNPLESVTQTRRPSIFRDTVNEFFGSTRDISTQSCSSSDTEQLITLSSPLSPNTQSNITSEPNDELPGDDSMGAEDAEQYSPLNIDTCSGTGEFRMNGGPNQDYRPIYRNFFPPNGPVSPARPMDYDNQSTETSDSDDGFLAPSQPHSPSDTDKSPANDYTGFESFCNIGPNPNNTTHTRRNEEDHNQKNQKNIGCIPKNGENLHHSLR